MNLVSQQQQQQQLDWIVWIVARDSCLHLSIYSINASFSRRCDAVGIVPLLDCDHAGAIVWRWRHEKKRWTRYASNIPGQTWKFQLRSVRRILFIYITHFWTSVNQHHWNLPTRCGLLFSCHESTTMQHVTYFRFCGRGWRHDFW